MMTRGEIYGATLYLEALAVIMLTQGRLGAAIASLALAGVFLLVRPIA